MLTCLEKYRSSHGFSSEVAAAMLSERPVQQALLRLALSALRVKPSDLREGGSTDYGSVPVRALYLVQTVLNQAAFSDSPHQRLAAAAFTRGLLRAQALQAASRQLAALAEALPAAAANQRRAQRHEGEDENQQGPGRKGGAGKAFMDNATRFLNVLAKFIYNLVDWAAHHQWDTLCMELAAALHDSGVLEHAARALLLVLPLVGRIGGTGSAHWRAVAAALAASGAAHFSAAGPILRCLTSSPLPGAAAAASQLCAALSGRCVQTAALSLGLMALCVADGGTTYGLPPDVLAALPLDTRDGAGNSDGGLGQGRLPQGSIFALVAALRLLALESRAQPPGRRGALSLALRAARLGVASAVAAAGAGEASAMGRGGGIRGAATASDVGSGGGSGDVARASAGGRSGTIAGANAGSSSTSRHQHWDPPYRVVEEDAIHFLCSAALGTARELLQRGHLASRSAHWRADAEEWWRLAVAAVRHTLRYATDHDRQILCDCLAWAADDEAEMWSEAGELLHLPLVPPPAIAAALGGGLLPCLERLMRRAGQAPQGPEAAVLRRLLGTAMPWRYLAPLIAYGDPRQAAALVATLGKLLRAIDPQVAIALAAWEPEAGTQRRLLWIACNMLFIFVGPFSTLPQLQEGGPAPVQQLARLMSLAACEWLPVLSRLALPAMQAALKQRKAKMGGSTTMLYDVPLPALLLWLPLLAAGCAGQGTTAPAASGAEGGTGAAGGGGPEGAGRASWRSLVLEEVGAVLLLGTALELAAAAAVDKWQGPEGEEEHPLWNPFMLRQLVDSCCAMVAMLATPGGCLGAALVAAVGVPPDSPAAAATGEGSSGAGPGPVDSGAEAAAAGLTWRPEHLRTVAAWLRTIEGEVNEMKAAAAEGLADGLEDLHEGDGAGAGSAAAPAGEPPPELRRLFEDALVSLSEARRLLRTCGNPGCTNLAGDSEAELPLQACAGCGAVGYCGRACQVAHWRAGHGATCKGRKKGGQKL